MPRPSKPPSTYESKSKSDIFTLDFKEIEKIINPTYYEKALGNTSRYEVFMGGAGSGKSRFIAQKKVLKVMMQKGHKILVIREVGATSEQSTFAEVEAAIYQLGVQSLWKCRKSQAALDWTFKPNGGIIMFKGYDDEQKVKSISGITDIWVEEATETTLKKLNQLDLRLRPPSHLKINPQITLSFNPINTVHWLNKRFFMESTLKNTFVMVTTYKDNNFLPDDYVEMIESYNDPDSPNYDEYYWMVYGLGLWGVIGNLVYTHIKAGPIWDDYTWPWQVVRNREEYENAPSLEEIPFEPDFWIAGCDFGYNNPNAVTSCFGYKGSIYIKEEVYQRRMTIPDLIERLKEIEFPRDIPLYCDSASPGSIEELIRAGFLAVPCDKGAGSVAEGIKLVKSFEIISCEDNTNLNVEIGSYSWKQNKAGDTLDIPKEVFDHGLDALRYALYTHLRQRLEDFDEMEVIELEDLLNDEIGFNLTHDLEI